MMRATSLGHAGILIESDHGSIVCDPWFVPAFWGSWFPFPRNDQLGDDLAARIERADFLYVSHLHGDHLDEPWLREHLPRDIGVLLPGYPTRELERRLRGLGFTEVIRTVDGEELDLGGLTVAIHVETSITDGPGGDSALVVSDGEVRVVDQNDCRTTDLDALRAHGPVDLHWLQYSGAIWYPMVYELPPGELHHLVDAKVDSQFARAMRYVEAVGAKAVVPSAGPPCFLDPDLFHLNVIDGDEPSIFRDQHTFLDRLARSGHRGLLAIPGTTIEVVAGVDRGPPPAARRAGRLDLHRQGAVPPRLPGRLDAVARQAQGRVVGLPRRRPPRHAEGVVGAAPGDRADGARGGRRGVPPARRRRGRARRLPRRRGPPVRRRGPSLPVRDRAQPRRGGRRRARRRLEQLAVPLLPVPGVARRRVQRVGLQLLQVAVRRADAPHRGRGRAQAAPAHPHRTGHRARRLDRPAPLSAPQRRPRGVRRDRGHDPDVHVARLALRPGDGAVSDRGRPSACGVQTESGPWTRRRVR